MQIKRVAEKQFRKAVQVFLVRAGWESAKLCFITYKPLMLYGFFKKDRIGYL